MTDKPFTLVKREDLSPVCPHCEEQLTEVYTRSKGVPFIQGTNVVYFCPHCLKVLGFCQGRMI
jgi:uncharacterized protein with PIN domain